MLSVGGPAGQPGSKGMKLWALLSWGPETCEFLGHLLNSRTRVSLPYQQDLVQQLSLGYKLFSTALVFLDAEGKTFGRCNQE